MTKYEVRKESRMLERIVKVFAVLFIGWVLGYIHCWFALMK